jgi:outer membrane lipoprotein-sorting protein
VPPRPRVASVHDLITEINAQSGAVHTLSAIVNLEASTGSVYSGAIKRYHNIRGYILFKAPDQIRVVGQAPVVHTDIFDMVSAGQRFRLYVPSQNKFYIGNSSVTGRAQNSLEKLRPQHIIDALVLRSIYPSDESFFREDEIENVNQYYVIGVLNPLKAGQVNLKRTIWFNRSNMQIVRVQLYGPGGEYLEDVHYSNYRDFGTVQFPGQINVARPEEGYSLAMTLLKALFNQPIPASKFSLPRPASAQIVNLSSTRP